MPTKDVNRPSGFGAKLWPRDVETLEMVREELSLTGDGSPVSFSDVVRFLLNEWRRKNNVDYAHYKKGAKS